MPGLDDFSASPAPVSAAPKPVQTAHAGGLDALHTAGGLDAFTQKPKGAASFLEKVSDYLDVPLAYGEAAIADLGKPGGVVWSAQPGSHWEQVNKDLMSGGAHAVAQNDIYFRQGSLQRVLADPSASADQKATAQWFLKHPWAAGAADFATEFLNPSNVLTGEAVGMAGKALRPVARLATKIPYLGQGIDATVNFGKSLVDKYHPLRLVSKKAAQVGRLSDAAARMATKHNEALQREVYGLQGAFKGTTAEERYEIWRRAHGMQPMTPEQLAQQFPHAPGFTGKAGTLSDVELTRRAQLERDTLQHLDQEQIQRGWTNPEDLMGDYFPIRPKQFYDERAFERAAAQFPGLPGRVAAAGLRYRGPNLSTKVFRTPDDILAANERMGGTLLAKGADPANEFLAHLNKVGGNIALDEFIRNLVNEAPEAAQEISAQKLGFHIPGGTVTKNGTTRQISSGEATLAKGLQMAQRNARSAAAKKAIDEIAQRFGMSAQDVSRIAKRLFPQEPRVLGRVAELKRVPYTLKKAGKVRRVGSLSGAQQGALISRGQELAAQLTDPERNIANEYRKLRDEFERSLQPQFRERMLQQLSPSGFNLVKNVPGLSGLQRLKHTELAPEVVKYLTDFGAPPKEANALGKFLDRFNALYRIGIVTNPIVHPFYNLLWGYLGQGGNPVRLARVFRSSETALDREAEKYGAHAYFNANSALGGSNASMLLGKFSQAPGMMGKADWLLSRAANANRALVFDRIERNMATELWDDLAKKNMARGMANEDAKRLAGEMVRKAFGDYDNISSAERNITRAFYFYPWTKTVIPFWIKAGIQRPQLVTAPMRGIQTHNVLAGDPNAATEKPFTQYEGTDANGQPVYRTLPLPQRWLEDVGEMITPRVSGQVDANAPIPAHLQSASNIVLGHLTPGLSVAANTGRQLANAEPQEPGVTPGEVVFNRAAPLGVQAQQFAQYAGQKLVPFGENIGNLAAALREAAKGRPEAIPAALTGGFIYAQRTPAQGHILNKYLGEFVSRYDRAFHIKDAATRDRIQAEAYRVFRMKVDRLLQHSGP